MSYSRTTDRTQSTYSQAREQQDTVKALATLFDNDAGRYERLLPSHIKLDDFRNAFLTSVQRNPRLLEADRGSFWLPLQQAASDGLKCDNREAALVIFSDDDDDDDGKGVARTSRGKPKVVVYMPMVAGLRKLIRNTGLVTTVETELVYRGEVVRLWREDGKRHMEHVTNTDPDADRSDQAIIGAYAIVNFKDGTWQAEWMSRSDIEKVRAVSRARSQRAPWQAWYSEMARKTALRRLVKQLDKSPEIAALDKALEHDPTLANTIDGEAIEIAEGIAARPAETPRTRDVQEDRRPEAAPPERHTTNRQPDAKPQAQPGVQHARTAAKEQPRMQSEPKQSQAQKDAVKTGVQQQPEEDPEAWRQDVGIAQNANSADAPTPPASNAAPDAGVTTPPDGGFEAWIVGADGVETTVDPFTDAVAFGRALAEACAANPEMRSDLLDTNSGAIEEACDASDEARQIIEAITAQAQDQSQDGHGGDAPAVDVVTPVPVPQTPGGKPHWPNYIAAVRQEMDRCQTVEALNARFEADKPTYFGKNMPAETQIQRHYRSLAEKLGASQGAARDRDREIVDGYLAEIAATKSLNDLRLMNDRGDVKAITARLGREKPELLDELRKATEAHVATLRAAA